MIEVIYKYTHKHIYIYRIMDDGVWEVTRVDGNFDLVSTK